MNQRCLTHFVFFLFHVFWPLFISTIEQHVQCFIMHLLSMVMSRNGMWVLWLTCPTVSHEIFYFILNPKNQKWKYLNFLSSHTNPFCNSVSLSCTVFNGALLFNRFICGPTWVNSTADQTDMFTGSHGKILCGAPFTPADSDALKTAVAACLKETGDGSCPIFAASTNVATGLPYRVMEAWDIRSVTALRGSKY